MEMSEVQVTQPLGVTFPRKWCQASWSVKHNAVLYRAVVRSLYKSPSIHSIRRFEESSLTRPRRSPKTARGKQKRKRRQDGSHLEEQAEEKPASQWPIAAKRYFRMDGSKVTCADFHAKSAILSTHELPDFNMIQQVPMGQNSVDTVTINKTGEWSAGQLLAYEGQSGSAVAASDDGLIKVWAIHSDFCLFPFCEHTIAVTAVELAKKGQVIFSASMDDMVHAWDLIRFRNSRTFTAPERVQFNSMAVDPSGQVVVAGPLLESLAGHGGPISCLAFGTEGSVLASSPWGKVIRQWNIFCRPQSAEQNVSEFSVSNLMLYDFEDPTQVHMLDIRKDVFSGRHLEDRFVPKIGARSEIFTTISYSFDGLIYGIPDEVLLRRFMVSESMTLYGMSKILNSAKITNAGLLIVLIDTSCEAMGKADRIDTSLPGSHRSDPSVRSRQPQVRVTSVRFSLTSSAFAETSTEGLSIYSTDSFRLDQQKFIDKVVESIPVSDIRVVCSDVPAVYVSRLLKYLAEKMSLTYSSQHIELNLLWVIRGQFPRPLHPQHKFEFQPHLRTIKTPDNTPRRTTRWPRTMRMSMRGNGKVLVERSNRLSRFQRSAGVH